MYKYFMMVSFMDRIGSVDPASDLNWMIKWLFQGCAGSHVLGPYMPRPTLTEQNAGVWTTAPQTEREEAYIHGLGTNS